MDKSEKISKFILKIIQMTNSGNIKWEIDENFVNQNFNSFEVLESFYTEIKGKYVRLMRKKEIKKSNPNDYLYNNTRFDIFGNRSYDDDNEYYSFEIFDRNSNITLHEYSISQSSLIDLSKKIKSQIAKPDDFINLFLDDE